MNDTLLPFEPSYPFVLASPNDTLIARGVARRLRGERATLGEEVAVHLESRRGDDEAPVLVGALPFDADAPAHLYEPRVAALTHGASTWTMAPASSDRATGSNRITAVPSRAQFASAVEAALKRLEGHDGTSLRKVVLARSLRVESDAEISPLDIIGRLRADHSVAAYNVPLPDATGGWRSLVGASPELLIRREGLTVTSQPLAGSARRHSDARLDREAADWLLASEKDQREHALVVEWVADRLAPYCRSLSVPRRPTLVSTSSMWHLGTRVHGELADREMSSVVLAAAVHPTPAVCGVPEAGARAAIRELEPFDRGFFTGAVGWCAANGDGEWMVAIRCAEITVHSAVLFAGAGIVAGSIPQAEVDETSAKFAALLGALAVDDTSLAQYGVT